MPKTPNPRRAIGQSQRVQLKPEQIAFLKALDEADGLISFACKASGVDRSIVEKWNDEDQDFKTEYEREKERVEERVVRMVEMLLFKAVREGDRGSIRFIQQRYGGHKMLSEILAGRNPHTRKLVQK